MSTGSCIRGYLAQAFRLERDRQGTGYDKMLLLTAPWCRRLTRFSTESATTCIAGAAAVWTRLALLVALLAPIASQAAGSIAWPTDGWQTSSPEEQGMSPVALADLVDFGAVNAMDSVLVVRHGRLVLDAYYAPFRPGMRHRVNSVTKGVVGTLVGIALNEGKLDRLDAPVLEFFPGRTIANGDARKKAITVQNLLDSNSGLSWREPPSVDSLDSTQMEGSADWVGFVLDQPMALAPGVSFNYNSGTWHLLSAIVGQQTGGDTLEYAKQKLFAPLGITDVAWLTDSHGTPIGGYGLFMQPRDMAKIGYLYLHGGQWAGAQVLPPQWVPKILNAQLDMQLRGAQRYANGWWVFPEKHAYMAVGYLCQLIVVLPEIDTVAVVTGRRSYPLVQLIDLVVSAAKSSTPLPPDAVGSARLKQRIAKASTGKRP